MNLDTILNTDKPAPAVVEAAVTPKVEPVEKPEVTPEAKTERSRDDKGKFAKGETAETPAAKTPETHESEEDRGLKAAASAERKKRQEIEKQREADRAELENLRKELALAKAPKLTNPAHFTEEDLARMTERTNLSVEILKESKSDFDEVMKDWALAIAEDESVYWRANQAKNPALFAYNYMKKFNAMRSIGDPEQFREKTRAEIRAEIEAEFATRTPAAKPSVPPPSLATAPSSGRISESNWSGPTPLTDVFKRK